VTIVDAMDTAIADARCGGTEPQGFVFRMSAGAMHALAAALQNNRWQLAYRGFRIEVTKALQNCDWRLEPL
jgi:hypothetical protein